MNMSKKRIQELGVGLKSKDDTIVLKTIGEIRDDGSNELLRDLAKLLCSTKNKEIKESIYNLFCDLKNQSSVEKLITFLNSEELKKAKKTLLSACWQTRLDFSDYLELFIDIVIKDPFEYSFEAFTVIENMESKVTRERKNELIEYTKSKISGVKDQNLDLAHDIIPIIERYEEFVKKEKLV